jgi:hypothetical protein
LKRVLAACFSALILSAALFLPPIQDETYYWTWSRTLALRYFDHPPAIAWVLGLSTRIFGDGVIGLRAPSLLSMLGVALLSSASARRLSGANASWLATLVLFGAPMFAIGYVPGTHDPLQGLATALGAYLVVRALEPGARFAWPFLAAFVLGASILIKHSAAIVALGVVIGSFSTTEGRRVLARPATLLGVLVAGLAIAPWLSSEASAHGGSIAFQSGRVFGGAPYRGPVAIPLMIGSIALTLGPITAAATIFGAVRSLGRDPVRSALGAGAIALLLSCLVAVWAGSGEANWAMPALVVALPIVASMAEGSSAIRVSALVCTAVNAVLLFHAVQPFLPIDPKRDPIHRGAGFDAVARAIEDASEELDAKAIATRRYQFASLARYHLRDRWPVIELRRPNERMSQYDLWPRPKLCTGDRVLFVWLDTKPPALEHLEPLEGFVPRSIERKRGDGAPIDTWWLTAWRVTEGEC